MTGQQITLGLVMVMVASTIALSNGGEVSERPGDRIPRPSLAPEWRQVRGRIVASPPCPSEQQFRSFEEGVATVMELSNAKRNEAAPQLLTALIGTSQQPMKDVVLTLRPKDDAVLIGDRIWRVTTDASGAFVFAGVPLGEYVISASAGEDSDKAPVTRWNLKHERNNDNAQLTYPSTIVAVKGKVTDAVGKPLPGVQLTAVRDGFNGELQKGTIQSHVVSAISEADGSYTLVGLIPSNPWEALRREAAYTIQAEHEGHATVDMTDNFLPQDLRVATKRMWQALLSSGDPDSKEALVKMMDSLHRYPCNGNTITDVDLVLGASASVSGRVLRSASSPLSSSAVQLVPVRDAAVEPAKGAHVPKRVQTNEEGDFEIRDVPAGTYSFRVIADRRGVNISGAPIILEHGEERTGIVLKYDILPLGRIEATVTDSGAGNPITNFSVYVARVANVAESWASRGTILKSPSDAGAFTVEDISSGVAELHLDAAGYAAERAHVAVPSGGVATLQVGMIKAGTAAVSLHRDGKSVMPMQLLAYSLSTNNITHSKRHLDDDGRYEITGLKPGRYMVQARVSEGRGSTHYESVPITVAADETTTATVNCSGNCELQLSLEFPEELRAHVQISDPISKHAGIYNGELGIHTTVWAKRSGDHAIKHLRPGTYQIRAWLTDPTDRGAAREEPLPEQKQTTTLHPKEPSSVSFHFESDDKASHKKDPQENL